MAAVVLWVRAELRGRWRSWAGLVLVIGLAGSAVLAAFPVLALLLAVPVGLALVNLLAILGGRAAIRGRPAVVLRGE